MTDRRYEFRSDGMAEAAMAGEAMPGEAPKKFYETGTHRTFSVVTDDGSTVVLPYGHFLQATYEPGEKGQVIKVMFSTATVVITGYVLKKLIDELRGLTLTKVWPHDERYNQDHPEDQPFIRSIQVMNRNENTSDDQSQ